MCVRIYLSPTNHFQRAQEPHNHLPLSQALIATHPTTNKHREPPTLLTTTSDDEDNDNNTMTNKPLTLVQCLLPDLPRRRHSSCRLAVDLPDASLAGPAQRRTLVLSPLRQLAIALPCRLVAVDLPSSTKSLVAGSAQKKTFVLLPRRQLTRRILSPCR